MQIFTGEGRGKTSAALGTIVRAVGHGLKVYIVFLMKGGNYPHGEFNTLSRLPGVTMASFGQRGWVKEGQVKPEHREQARQALANARQAMLSGDYDLLVLDEINVAVAHHLIELDAVLRLIKDKPPKVELILTGRNADPALVSAADLVSEITMIKHPYNEGIQARKGIDY
ncbi:MAG: cob(I)yrinic acid a,c-diamide adenosyltransferase [Chloroflexota bacterium]